MSISSIDGLLAEQGTPTPAMNPPTVSLDRDEVPDDVPRETTAAEDSPEPQEENSADSDTHVRETTEIDEYGNEKAAAKVYTEDEVNERINQAVRERLARVERSAPPTAQQVQQAKEVGFEANENSPEDWQSQLASFVRNEYAKMNQEQTAQVQANKERALQDEFESKFQQGRARFSDFNSVVQAEHFSDAMTVATRGMKDPAAFVYAASKRAGPDLERISKLQDPYAQMVEIGKLEERMRAQKPVTKTPKPIGRAAEDAGMVHRDENPKSPSIEQLIALSERQKVAKFNAHRK